MKWIAVREALPTIPEGRYGLRVLVAEFDACYDECSPGHGYSVREMHYGTYHNRNGERDANFANCKGTEGFMQLEDLGEGLKWYPPWDHITHWMHLPDPPEYNGADLNPIFKRYFENARPTTHPLKVVGESQDTLER